MDTIVSKCCNAFTINKGNLIVCTNCGNIVGEVEDEDVIVGITYNNNPEIIRTLNMSSSFVQTAQRLAKDVTCMLVDNKICKCGGKCRFLRDTSGQPVYVCSECRQILQE